MKKETLSLLFNPFKKIAGFKALCWGFIGLIASMVLSIVTNFHYQGFLRFGGALKSAWWFFAAEHLAVWLVPATLFYIGGLIFSGSKIRIIDIFGTTLFAQIPFVIMNLFVLPPVVQRAMNIDLNMSLQNIVTDPDYISGTRIFMVSIIFLILTLVWMFNALRVSCNLKGGKLAIVYIVGILLGDFICKLIIKQLY